MTDAPGAGHRSASAGPAVPRGRVVMSCLAIMSVATAVIHFAAAGSHFREYWLFGLFMLVAAWLQSLWAVAAVARPSRLVLWSGAALNSVVVVVYILTRTVGDVIGPTPRAVEQFGFGDGLCTVLEAIVLAGCARLLIAEMNGGVRRDWLIRAPAATGGVTAVLLSVALVAGGPDMVMSAASAGTRPAMHMSGPATRRISLVTSTPAGNITMPDPGMQMAPGMRMASAAACDTAPTGAQQRSAVRLVDASWKESRKYQSLAVAKAAGYRPITPVGLPVVHYLNLSYYLAAFMGRPVLNPAAPQSLVYANTPRGAVLVAAMYITTPGGPTPQPGGCLTQWHLHTNLCLARGQGVVGIINAAHPTCPPGSQNRVTPPMLHIWFVPIPGGPTAIDASDQQLVHAAEQVAAPKNGTA